MVGERPAPERPDGGPDEDNTDKNSLMERRERKALSDENQSAGNNARIVPKKQTTKRRKNSRDVDEFGC